MARDRATEILEVKGRDRFGRSYASIDLQQLRSKWDRYKVQEACTPDFFIIRAVTLLEVFIKRNISQLIDHSKDHTERAVGIAKQIKLEFELVRHIQDRAITLGDIVAHSISLNSFDQIIKPFDVLLGKDLVPLLKVAVDRYASIRSSIPATPIIEDFGNLAARMARLYELRHILCHEVPTKQVYQTAEVSGLLDAAERFSKALQEVVTFERFGLVPLDQTSMNIAAAKELKASEDQLAELFTLIHSRVDDQGKTMFQVQDFRAPKQSVSEWIKMLEESQEKWLAYRNLFIEFTTYQNLGGTIHSALWASQAKTMTEKRTSELRSWLESDKLMRGED